MEKLITEFSKGISATHCEVLLPMTWTVFGHCKTIRQRPTHRTAVERLQCVKCSHFIEQKRVFRGHMHMWLSNVDALPRKKNHCAAGSLAPTCRDKTHLPPLCFRSSPKTQRERKSRQPRKGVEFRRQFSAKTVVFEVRLNGERKGAG